MQSQFNKGLRAIARKYDVDFKRFNSRLPSLPYKIILSQM